jgi:cytidine deaminase
MCAERNAIANMITNGENKITKLVCCFSDGKPGLPCGACRKFLMQLDKDSGNIEILINNETMETIKLRDLMPMWWGDRYGLF